MSRRNIGREENIGECPITDSSHCLSVTVSVSCYLSVCLCLSAFLDHSLLSSVCLSVYLSVCLSPLFRDSYQTLKECLLCPQIWLSGWPSVNPLALTTATRVRQLASACEMVMCSPSQTGWFPPGTPVSSHTKTFRTQTSLPTSMMFRNCCKINKSLKYN